MILREVVREKERKRERERLREILNAKERFEGERERF